MAFVSCLVESAGFQRFVARELEARHHDDLVGLAAHRVGEAAEGAGAARDGLGAPVQREVAGGFHHFGVQHAAVEVDGDDHGQLAIQLLAGHSGKFCVPRSSILRRSAS